MTLGTDDLRKDRVPTATSKTRDKISWVAGKSVPANGYWITAGELAKLLSEMDDFVMVCVKGGPVVDMVYERGANEPFVFLSIDRLQEESK